jgi:pyridoxal phosphate-dependent enzymes, D-cysteine desulfhydrase family
LHACRSTLEDPPHLPTPLEFLPRLSRELGPRIFIKRDDLTGLAGGGNKTRKLEYLLAEALSHKADTLVTVGAVQSNHCRQTAAAAARAGLRCVLVLRGHPPANINGNLLLDHLLGAELRWTGDRPREAVYAEVVAAERAAGRRVYAIPLGGSTALGAAAYAAAMAELEQQREVQSVSFDRILFASSSGGTQAGMVVGAALSALRGGQVLGVSVDLAETELKSLVAGLATETAALLATPRVYAAADIHVNADYLGEGYAVLGEREREAIGLFAQLEGVLLDPVYTGRAAAGMLDLIRRRVIGRDETLLFWHTGGQPALFAYQTQLLR